jgi:hypothetical protein
MFWVLGFIPAYILGMICKSCGILRIPKAIELAGLDRAEGLDHAVLESEIVAAEQEEARAAGLI